MPIAYLPLADLVRGAVTDIKPEPSITEYDWTTEISSIIALPSGFGQGTTIYRVYHESIWITPFDDSKTPTSLVLYIIKSDQSSYKTLTIPYGQWADVEIYDYYKIIACPASNGRGYPKPECYDENHNPIAGRMYPKCNGLKFDYREWRLTPNGIMIEEMPDPALPTHEPLPYSIWRLTPSERDYIFHRRLPGHLPPEPPPPEPDLPFEDIPTLEYDVYCDGKPMHIGTSPLESYRLMDGILTLQDSAAGSFEFTISSFHTLYNTVEMMASTITVVLNGEEIWEGRPVSFKENLWKEHAVTCEGALAYLNDIYLPPMSWTNTTPDVILRNIIDGSDGSLSTNTYCYNVKCAENRKIYVGAVPTPDASKYTVDVEKYVCGYDTVLNVVFDICKKWGYHIYMEKVIDETTGNKIRKIQFKGDEGYGENASQKIVFGRNLVDYSKSYNFATIVTALLPLGAKLSTSKKVEIDEISSPWTPDRSAGYKVVERYTYVENNTKYQITREAITESSNNYILYELDLYNKNYNYVYVTTKVSAPWVDSSSNKHEPAFFAIRTGESGSYTYYEAKYGKGAAGEGTIMSKHKIDVTQFQNEPTAVLLISYYNDGTLNGMVINRCKTSDEAQEEYVTIADIVDGTYDQTTGSYSGYTEPDSLYAISPRADEAGKTPIQRYGRIEKKIEWSDVKDSTTLYNNAVSYLNSDQFDGLQIEMTAMDMKMFNVNVNRLRVGEFVHCVAPPYGLDKLMPIRALKIPILKPEDAKYTVGDSRQSTLTSTQNASNDELARLIGEKPTIGSVLVAAKQTAYDMLTNYSNSYVSFKYDDAGGISAIIISDTVPYNQSSHGYWIWNANGLGFVTSGTSEQNVAAAITNDGKIVADFIAAGTMFADRIRGGTLKLGGYATYDVDAQTTSYQNGLFKIMGVPTINPLSPDPVVENILLRFGREADQSHPNGNYEWGLENFSSPNSDDVPFSQQNTGSWMALTNGNICFGFHSGGTVIDGFSADERPRIFGGVSYGDPSDDGDTTYAGIAIQVPQNGSLFLNVPKLRVRGYLRSPDSSSRTEEEWSARTGDDYIQCGNKELVFLKGILMDIRNASGSAPVSSATFDTADGKRVTVTEGLITDITTIPSNNNNS